MPPCSQLTTAPDVPRLGATQTLFVGIMELGARTWSCTLGMLLSNYVLTVVISTRVHQSSVSVSDLARWSHLKITTIEDLIHPKIGDGTIEQDKAS